MVLFYVVSFYYDFFTSTLLYVLTTLLVVIIMLLREKRLPYLSLIFGFFVIASGIATIASNNPDILIISDSIYFFLGAIILLYSTRCNKTVLELLFSPSFAITREGWQILTWLWIAIFTVAGTTNELVRIFMTPEWWIGFQFWRGCAIAAISVGFLLVTKKYRLPDASAWGIRLHA